MSVNDFMATHGFSDTDLDRMAAPYEDGDFEPEPGGKVFNGSHLDAVGTRRVTDEEGQWLERPACRDQAQLTM